MPTLTKIKVSGKQTLSYTRQARSNIGDVEGYMLSLIEAEGVNISTGETDLMNRAQVLNCVTSDLVNFNGPIQGYSITRKENDSSFGKSEGKITTTLSHDGTPVATIEAKLTWIKGTGQFKDIQGYATAEGIYISKTFIQLIGRANTGSKSK